MIRSRGVLAAVRTKSTSVLWQGSPKDWPEWLSFAQTSYAAIYERDLWVNVLVDKIANAAARLPLHTYEQVPDGRVDAGDSPYGRLLANPSTVLDPYLWKLWIFSTIGVYGEAFLGKVRDRGGRPVELVPLHPTRVRDEVDSDTGRVRWSVGGNVTAKRDPIARRDLVHFRGYSPSSTRRGLSKLEPLRATLENEYGARQANAAMWRNGGRPSVVLEHPAELSDPALSRLRTQWNETHAGVQNWAKAVILEEGMKANILPLNVEELQYVDGRRLNREEACAAYDVPPPVVHILDRATFSNITAQMRSMYRDTMAPKLGLVESTLEYEVRDGRMGEDVGPDFGGEFRAKFLMDEVLRGDFEQRMTAYQQADFMTIAEKREKENLPHIDGTDRIFINAASLPLGTDGTLEQPQPTVADMRSMTARISRAATVGDVNVDYVVRGLTAAGTAVFMDAVSSLPTDTPIDDLRTILRGVTA